MHIHFKKGEITMPKNIFGKLSFTARVAICICITVIFALTCCLGFAAAASAAEDPGKSLLLYGEICFCLTMLFCGFFGARTGGDRRFVGGITSSGIMLLTIAALSLLFDGTSTVKSLVLILLGAFFASLGALLGSKEKKRKRRH